MSLKDAIIKILVMNRNRYLDANNVSSILYAVFGYRKTLKSVNNRLSELAQSKIIDVKHVTNSYGFTKNYYKFPYTNTIESNGKVYKE